MSHTSSIPVIGKRDDPRWALALAFSLFLMVFMPSSESLWVDEGYIAQIISHPRLLDMLSALHCHSGSEPHMPLAALFYWTWGKFFGHSELALRIANLLPLGLGIIALALACRPQRMVWPFLLVAASPMTWFYVNEIRPYALQLGGSAGAAASLLVAIVYGKLNTTWTIVLCVSCLIVAASSLLGLFCLFGVVAVLGFQLLRGRFYLRRNNWFVAIPAFLLFVLLCVYYSWTLLSGSGSARDRGVSLSGVGYFFYELLGFGGLGPGRLDIREISSRGVASMANLFSPFIPQLTLLAIVWLLICAILVVMAVCLMKARSQTVEAFVLILSPLPIGLGLLFLAALVMVFPVWGRHVVWILPFGVTVQVD